MELLLPVLLKFLPYILGVIGVAAMYFGIKRKGVVQERERQEAKRVEEVKQVQVEINKAISKDEEIDKRVQEDVQKIKKIEQDHGSTVPGSQFKF